MGYVDFAYYQAEYGGTVITADDVFRTFERRAARKIDAATSDKLTFAFPVEERAAQTVKDCICSLTDLLYQVARYNETSMSAVGSVEQKDGTVKGKVIKSVSSGTESVSYATAGDTATTISEAAKDRKVLDSEVYSIIRDGLSFVGDANGVNLLYAGPYPGERCLWE